MWHAAIELYMIEFVAFRMSKTVAILLGCANRWHKPSPP